MKLYINLFTAAIATSQGAAFQLKHRTGDVASRFSWGQRVSPQYLSTPSEDDMLRIMQEESMNPATLAESAERMKNMTQEVSSNSHATLYLTIMTVN